METKENTKKKGNKKSKKSYFRRHFLFFIFVVGFAILLKKYPGFFKEVVSIQISKRVKYANTKNIPTAYSDCVEQLGEAKCTLSEDTREKYKRDRSHHPAGMPSMVVFPESLEDVVTIMKICNKRNVIVIPMGMNSGLEGQTNPYEGGVVVNVMKLRNIVEYYPDDFHVTVEPGLRISEINEYLEDKGAFFPVSPASNPSVGGAVSTGASGTLTPKYQTMKENVVNVQLVLANGDVTWTRSRAPKSAAGFDLTALVVGSEGTLGIVTKVTLKLSKIPKHVSAAVVNFDTLEQAAKTTIEIKQRQVAGVARMEIVNKEGIMVVNEFNNANHVVKPSLFLEFHGNTEDEVMQSAKMFGDISRVHGGGDFKWSVDENEIKELWNVRNSAYFAASKSRKGCTTCRLFSTDICVPNSRFAQAITESVEDFQKHGFQTTIVGHSGDGNFHMLIPVDWSDAKEVEMLEQCNKRLVKRAIAFDGTCTGEHGIGYGKKYALVMELGEIAVDMMRKIKTALDPKNMLNPNKVFDR